MWTAPTLDNVMTDASEHRRAVPSGRFNRDRLRMAREISSLSQAQLADGIVTAASISQYERGGATPSPRTLRQLAERLGVGVEFLALTDSEADTPAYFRSLRSAPSSELKLARHMVQLVHQITLELETDVKLPPLDLPRNRLDADASEDAPEEAAERVRRDWGLPPAPIDHIVRLLERHGIVVARLDRGHEKIDAFSVAFSDRPVVMMSAAKGKKDRSRYDIAHELGHLVMHQPGQRATKTAETQAQRFAAAFLLPAACVRHQLPAFPDWDRLIALKRQWQVSIASLLYRAKTLGVMDDDVYVGAMKVLSARGWRRHEPADLGEPEAPAMLNKAMEVAGVDERRLAVRTAMPLDLLRRILDLAADDRPRIVL